MQLGGFWLPGMAVRLTATGPAPGSGGGGGGRGGGGGPGGPVGVGDGVEVPIVTLIAALALRDRSLLRGRVTAVRKRGVAAKQRCSAKSAPAPANPWFSRMAIYMQRMQGFLTCVPFDVNERG